MVDCWTFALVLVIVGEDLVGWPIAAIKDHSKIWDFIIVGESLNLYHIESIVINKWKCDISSYFLKSSQKADEDQQLAGIFVWLWFLLKKMS